MYQSTDLMLQIPALDQEMRIVGVPNTSSGWDVSWLGDDAGYLYGSAFPTWEGNTVLSAHVWDANNNPGPFANLKDLRMRQEETAETAATRRSKYFQSSAGYLRVK